MANIFSRLFFGPTGGALPLSMASSPVPTGIVSPWQDSSLLSKVAYSELFSGAADIVTREVAMTVAPVKRGRAIIVGKLADLPLVAGNWSDGNFVATNRQPAWLSNTATNVPLWHRMAMTIDDLIFHGYSLWALERSEVGTILDARRVPIHRWNFDSHSPTGIAVDNVHVTDPASVIFFTGPDEGLLKTGAQTIRGAIAMEVAWVGRVQNPVPMTVLHEVNTGQGSRITAAEAQQYVQTWQEARTSPNGAVGFLPATLQMETYGDVQANLFENGRNQIRLDIANFMNLPASILDGSANSASLTYETREGERQELIEWLEYWLAPIESRLSAPDITPRGQYIRFDRTNLIAVPNQDHGPVGADAGAIQEVTPNES